MRHVFISYVREDQKLVDQLCSDLRSKGVTVWLDRDQIQPGERWKHAIRGAIRGGALFLACFSPQYHSRDQTYMNEELTIAVEQLRLMTEDRAWFIPVILSKCPLPNRSIGAGQTLEDLQWVSLAEDWSGGIEK